MPAPQPVLHLIANFAEHLDEYRAGALNETQVRRDFIDPFFAELGWDMDNKAGYAEAYRDVVHEDKVQVRTGSKEQVKAPDYGFRIGGTRKFFLEAKKPSVRIREEASPAYQLRRYAWSAKLPLSILTDFEEFAIYDCRVKPAPTDAASKSRLLYFTFDQYAERWDEIAAVFSKQAVLKGSFDKYALTTKGKRGTTAVDDEFLATIEVWRADLARNIALRNPALSQRELNFAVQRTLDRIIFLRICEDRGIEDYERLKKAAEGKGIYPRLVQLFQQADDRYNSGIFHFQQEKGRNEAHDTLTPGLAVDDALLRRLITGLYYPDSPYEFSVLSADILGSVYEQFLGKVITLTAGHQAKVEDKPEVKKAGGVFYTPVYIVDYIVRQTIGPLLEGKTPKQIAKLRILDPACGSGSFLIGAYQFMLDWYHHWYSTHDPEKHAKGKDPAIFPGKGGGWVLTTAERKRILLAHIHGVDIDSQAVEVTKLSLLLKVLEGETAQSVQRELIQQRVLPDLGDNIKCGNSLIGSDFYSQPDLPDMTEDECLRINCFDWAGKDGFPDIMKDGGFDAVIGNPPWGSFFNDEEKHYLWGHYSNVKGEAESHLFFMEKASTLLRSHGRLGFITPNTWLSVANSAETRQFLLLNMHLLEMREMSKYIFANAPDIVPLLVFAEKGRVTDGECKVSRPLVTKLNAGNFLSDVTEDKIAHCIWLNHPGYIINLRQTDKVRAVTSKCAAIGTHLGAVSTLLYGIKTGDNSKYVARAETEKHNVKCLKTGEIGRYRLEWQGFWLWWGPHLAGFRKTNIEVPKIIIQYIRKISLPRRIIATLDQTGEFYPLNNYSYVIEKGADYPIKFILGVMNSSLLNFFFANTFNDYNIKPAYLSKLPVPFMTEVSTVQRRDRIVALVEKRLALPEQLKGAKTPQERTVLERQITAVDDQIDEEVYALYGLTDAEKELVMNA